MSRTPVTLADQGIFIEPEDADELTDLLADAAWVIGHLAGQQAAEDACARAPARQGSCAELAMDLRLAAAGLDEAATAGQENHYMAAHCRKQASPAGKRPRHAPENQHSEKGK
ncbi:MAG TPA: hypothetical protein VMV92_21975 [Streptosporangiaceae bacterium]|nr:hypothetical protein [Streptosporangiaceae bacterium]